MLIDQELKRLKELEERERKTQELLRSSQETEAQRKARQGMSKPMDKQLQARNDALEKAQRFSLAFDQIREATGGTSLLY